MIRRRVRQKNSRLALSGLFVAVAFLLLSLGASAFGAVQNEAEVHENSGNYTTAVCVDCHDTLTNVAGIGGWWNAHRRHFVSVFLTFIRNDGGTSSFGCAKCHRETTLPTFYEGDLSFTTSTASNEAGRQVRPGVCRECHGQFRKSKHFFSGAEQDYVAQGARCTQCHKSGGIGLDPELAHGSDVLDSSTSVDPSAAGIWWIDQRYANAKDFCPRCHGGFAWFETEETNAGISCGFDLCHKTSASSFLDDGTDDFLRYDAIDTTVPFSHGIHFDPARGPGITTCDDCHGANASTGDHNGHKNGTKNFNGVALEDLSATTACNSCHSPFGAYNGVNSVIDSVGAKDTWSTGAYDSSATLIAGKEKWCVGCHDDVPPAINGQFAPEIGGDGSGYGYYVSGHGVGSGNKFDNDVVGDAAGNTGAAALCADCHDLTSQHLNTKDDTDHAGQRLDGSVNGTSSPTLAAVCKACHDYSAGLESSTVLVSNHGNDAGGGYGPSLEETFTVECPICHEPHGNNDSGGTRNLKMVRASINSTPIVFRRTSGTNSYDTSDTDDADDICVTCHQTATNNPGFPMAIHEGGKDHTDTPTDRREVDCTSCHAHDYADDNDVANDDGFMPVECSGCHSYPPGTDQGTYKGTKTHTMHVVTYGLECTECHNKYPAEHNESGVGSSSNWASLFDPDNLDIYFDSAMNPDGTATVVTSAPDQNRQCADLYCHGQKGYLASSLSTTDTTEAKNVRKFGGTNASTTPNIPTWDDPDSTNTGDYDIMKITGACGTCHDNVRQNFDASDTVWPTWDTTGQSNDWSPQLSGGAGVDTTVWDVTPNSSIGSVFEEEFGWSAYETHMDSVRGPKVTCYPCHPVPPTAAGDTTPTNTHVNQLLDFVIYSTGETTPSLDDTDVCGDICHSEDGAFDGANDPTVGAKNVWPNTVLDETTDPPVLLAGKENWCLGCHDYSLVPIGIAQEPPNIAGNDTTYGFNVSGHGLPAAQQYDGDQLGDTAGNAGAGKQCLVCHDDRKTHWDGIDGTNTSQLRMRETINGVATSNDVYTVCKACHQNSGGAESASATSQVSTHGNEESEGFTATETAFFIQCQVCHEPHGRNLNIDDNRNIRMIRSTVNSTDIVFTSTTGTDSFDEIDSNDGDDICVTCHIVSENNPGFPMSGHDGGSGHEDIGDRRGEDCTLCHNHDFKNNGNVTPNNGLMPLNCGDCHTYPAGGAQGTYEGSVTHDTHVAGYGYACPTCHNDFPNNHNGSGVSSAGDWKANFDPAEVNIDFSNINASGTTQISTGTVGRGDPVLFGTVDSNRQCLDLYCHAQAGSVGGKDFSEMGGTNQIGNIPLWDNQYNEEPGRMPAITQMTGDCGTCHDATQDNSATVGNFFPTWDTTDSDNNWSVEDSATVWDATAGSSIGTSSVGHSTHLDKTRSIQTVCNTCHATPPSVTGAESTATPAKHVNQALDFSDATTTLAGTTVCNDCHSPSGAYNGVTSTGDSIGAKDNWTAGVYETISTTNTLAAGKEAWCVGCHDASNIVPSIIRDATAPAVGGDASSYGFFATGHGRNRTVNCLDCHDSDIEHVDGDPRTYAWTGDAQGNSDFRLGYRLISVDSTSPMVVPINSVSISSREDNFRLCWKCHNQDSVFSSTATPSSNFMRRGAYAGFSNDRVNDAEAAAAGNSHANMLNPAETQAFGDMWNSDWDDNTGPSSGFESGTQCLTCHNVHGSSYAAMIRDGKLSGKDASATGYDGLEFSYVTLDSTTPRTVVPALGPQVWGTSSGAVTTNSLGGIIRMIGNTTDQRTCSTNSGCHGAESQIASAPKYQINAIPAISGIEPGEENKTNVIDYYRDPIPLALSALFTSDDTITVVFNEPVTASAAHFTPGGLVTKNGQFSGGGTSVIEVGINSTSDSTGTIDISSGVQSGANGTSLTAISGQGIWNGR